jgi:bifunctional non-homologous end joining protein LigD
MATYILPHLKDRAMVMRRYPSGINGKSFFMKQAPVKRPKWLDVCSIEHTHHVIDFPVVHDIPSLLYIVNLGCIDLNQWYATCDDVQRPDYLHFDLDPVPNADFNKVLETALLVRTNLAKRGIPCYAKTTGSRGVHIYTPIVRGPVQKEVWTFAKRLAVELAAQHPKLITTEYRIAKRPADHVLVDYNQNAWGRTLASVYSVRPKPHAPVSTPVTWEEIERGIRIEDFLLGNVPQRVRQVGDLWKPLLQKKGRVKLERHI